MNDSWFRLPVGQWAEVAVDWVTRTFAWFFDIIKTVMTSAYNGVDTALTWPPFWAMILVFAALAWWAKGWKLALGTAVGMLVISSMNQWVNAMHTLALVIIATVIALVIALPLGILAARSDRFSAAIRPVLDFMQTMPAFVYLIPAVVIFFTGVVPGLVATVIFALPPGVRFAELGIRGVDPEIVEAGEAFGDTQGRILTRIQIPLAMPTIMAGINQVIMLALSMVVVAGMVGAPGLGSEVIRALSSINVSLGFEAGLGVVIIAMYLDRVTSALGRNGRNGRTPNRSSGH